MNELISIDDLLLRDAALHRLPRPSARVQQNFRTFLMTENPFSPADKRFIYHKHDFVSLRALEDESWLENLLRTSMPHCRKTFLRVSLPPSTFGNINIRSRSAFLQVPKVPRPPIRKSSTIPKIDYESSWGASY